MEHAWALGLDGFVESSVLMCYDYSYDPADYLLRSSWFGALQTRLSRTENESSVSIAQSVSEGTDLIFFHVF